MSVWATNLKGIVAATLLLLVNGLFQPVFAQTGLNEDELLSALAVADREEALGLDRELQALWAKSGSASMDLLLRRGRDAQERGDLHEAIEHLTALTDHAPDFAEGWHARAAAYFEIGLYGPALADLERALHLNPRNYNAIFGLGAMFEQFEDAPRAYDAYSRAQAIHPHHEEVTTALERLKPLVEGKEL
ncbi:MAG: tetratricopeptide repeat protein [Paracoccaceae bacterium]